VELEINFTAALLLVVVVVQLVQVVVVVDGKGERASERASASKSTIVMIFRCLFQIESLLGRFVVARVSSASQLPYCAQTH